MAQKFVVRRAALTVAGPDGRPRKAEIGEVVELSSAMAKALAAKGRIGPFISDDPEPAPEPAAAEEAPKRRRRAVAADDD